MIKNIFLAGFILLVFISCQNYNVKVQGTVKGAQKQQIYLDQLNVEGVITVDSVKANREGQFTFKTNISLPTFYNIRIGKQETITLLAEADQKIKINGELDHLRNNYWIEGSEGSLWVKLLNFQLNRTLSALDSLKNLYATLPENKATETWRATIAAEWDSVLVQQVRFSRNFIVQHAISPASYYALYQKINDDNFILSPETDLQSYKIVLSSLLAMYPESQYTKALNTHYEKIQKDIQTHKMRELILQSENSLPEINLPDIHGNPVSLNSLRGKYIILDFTVLATPESSEYINALKAVYNKFRHKGVEIYQVCLDQNKLLWEELVRKYDIKWLCVRDPEALKSKAARDFNIQQVPSNYIINKDFDIAGKNLYGKRMEDRIQDLLNK